MKIQVISDLHLEFGIHPPHYNEMVNTQSDVLVLAGDISTCRKVLSHLGEIQKDANKPVVFVPGNHEYYGFRKDRSDRMLREFNESNDNIHILIEDTVTIDDVDFIGTTGWWDGSNGAITDKVKRCLNDFYHIFDTIDNNEGLDWGDISREFLIDVLSQEKKNKRCVITHHYPHENSVSPQYKGDELNTCFGNKWEWIIDKYQPECWIHGHTHSSFDYMVNKTHIVCNPQGYLMEDYIGSGEYLTTLENTEFNPSKVIEL